MHKKLNVLLPVGGHVELGETPWQAISHELAEESGYQFNQLQIIQPRSRIKTMTKVVQHPYPLSMNTHDITSEHYHTDIEYGFITSEDPHLEIGGDESVDIRWVTKQELSDLPSSMIFDNIRETYNFLFTEALTNLDRISTSDFILEFPNDYIK
jgi:8-oxo-dGTP pyrophosphatase MutT (NUDIX family)